MKLAALLALPFALALLPRAEHTAADLGPARPLGFHTPHWDRQTWDLAERAANDWSGLPPSVAARLKSLEGEMLVPQVLGRCNTPSGLELWIFEQDHQDAGWPDLWRIFLRDPRTDDLTQQTITLTDKWIESEAPRVRFIDLDDDGRDELAFRQFEHNGTMTNNDVELYFRVEDDLALNHCLVQLTDIRDLYSECESGAIRSQLMLTDSGALVADVWHENPRFGVKRTPIGRVHLALGVDGYFESTRLERWKCDVEGEKPYEWTLEHCLSESTTNYRGRPFPRSEPEVR